VDVAVRIPSWSGGGRGFASGFVAAWRETQSRLGHGEQRPVREHQQGLCRPGPGYFCFCFFFLFPLVEPREAASSPIPPLGVRTRCRFAIRGRRPAPRARVIGPEHGLERPRRGRPGVGCRDDQRSLPSCEHRLGRFERALPLAGSWGMGVNRRLVDDQRGHGRQPGRSPRRPRARKSRDGIGVGCAIVAPVGIRDWNSGTSRRSSAPR